MTVRLILKKSGAVNSKAINAFIMDRGNQFLSYEGETEESIRNQFLEFTKPIKKVVRRRIKG